MFVHPNFPAQFGHLAYFLNTEMHWPVTFMTSVDTTHLQLPFNHINYRVYPGPQPKAFFNPDNIQGFFDHMLAIYKGLRTNPRIRPDLVVGHMSYGTMLYLKALYSCPFIGFFELLPPPFWSDQLVLRKEFLPPESVRLFNASFHVFTYLHLHTVDGAYTHSNFQLKLAPPELRGKIRVLPSGIDTNLFQRRAIPRPAEFHGLTIAPGTRVVTYVSRGLESVRGFDIFMKVAHRLSTQMDNVVFLIAGEEQTTMGHELHHLGSQSFKQYVLSQERFDLSKFHFLGMVPIQELATLYNLSDLHISLTVPYILQESLLQAMASECLILSTANEAVQEVVDPGVQARLFDFYDVDGMASQALEMLREPEAYRALGAAARARILERHDQKRCFTDLANFFLSQGPAQSMDTFFEKV
jgi:glycosyltransferase involved in cell wall biosynthesis